MFKNQISIKLVVYVILSIFLSLQFVSIMVTWFLTNLKNIIRNESKDELIEKQEEVSLRPEQIEL